MCSTRNPNSPEQKNTKTTKKQLFPNSPEQKKQKATFPRTKPFPSKRRISFGKSPQAPTSCRRTALRCEAGALEKGSGDSPIFLKKGFLFFSSFFFFFFFLGFLSFFLFKFYFSNVS